MQAHGVVVFLDCLFVVDEGCRWSAGEHLTSFSLCSRGVNDRVRLRLLKTGTSTILDYVISVLDATAYSHSSLFVD